MLPILPSRQARPSDDPIFSLHQEALARRAKGESIVNATLGSLMDDDGKLAVLPAVTRAIAEVPPAEWAAYAPISGLPDFVNAVMDDMLGTVPALRETALAVATPGGSGALRNAIGNYIDRGQSILTTSYFWSPYRIICDEIERGVETFNMFTPSGAFDVSAMDQAIGKQVASQGRSLVVLNTPCHNPTGFSLSQDEWRAASEALVAHGKRAPVTVLVDVAYFLYAAGDPRAFLETLVPLLGTVGLTFAWSASKSFTHYGLRVGALIGCVKDDAERAATLAAYNYSCRGTWSNCNRGGLRAVANVLTTPSLKSAADSEREELKAMLQGRVRKFNELAQSAGLNYPRYEGGFFVTTFEKDAKAKAARMRERGVYVVPLQDALRVGICAVTEGELPRLVDALANA